jgi:hypothetical protein
MVTIWLRPASRQQGVHHGTTGRLYRRCPVGDRGIILTRTGRYPKRAIPFRTDEPFKKITVTLIAPDGNEEKIEFPGDGQYLACFGIHPDTGQPYTWRGGAPGEIARDALPYISGEEAQQLVDDIIEMLVHCFGYTPIGLA